MMKKAKKDADAWWSRRQCENFEANETNVWESCRKGEGRRNGKEEVVKGVSGQLWLESGDVGRRSILKRY